MSCYICDDETLTIVLKAWLMNKSTQPRTQEEMNQAWEEIVRANYQAFTDRYGSTHEEFSDTTPPPDALVCPLTIEDWFYTPEEDRPSKAERYSALKQYMYQCAEGDYHDRQGYYKSQWCLDDMLRDYMQAEFPDATGWGF